MTTRKITGVFVSVKAPDFDGSNRYFYSLFIGFECYSTVVRFSTREEAANRLKFRRKLWAGMAQNLTWPTTR